MAPEQSHAVLDHRITTVEKAVERVTVAVESIDKSLQVFARLEVEHAETRGALNRAFQELEKHDVRIMRCEADGPKVVSMQGILLSHKNDCDVTLKDHEVRVRSIETEMPTIVQARGWIFTSVASIVGVVGLAVVYLVVK